MAVQLVPHNLTGNTSLFPLVISASGQWGVDYQPYEVFDNGLGNWSYWATGGETGWWKIDFGSIIRMDNYSLQCTIINQTSLMPKDWTLQGSNDNINWYTVDTVTNQTGWSNGETRNYVCDDKTYAFRYFRINITAGNGGGSLIIGELYLFGDDLNPNLQGIHVSNEGTEVIFGQIFKPALVSQEIVETIFGNMFKPVTVGQELVETIFGNMYQPVCLGQEIVEVFFEFVPGKIYTYNVAFE